MEDVCEAMKDNELVDINNPVSEPNGLPTESLSTYELLVRQSKKLGGVATKIIERNTKIPTKFVQSLIMK